ncbi:sugar-binding transcriptional regulator [Companilactobacillus huachuanensis]|uniref:Sugar-binding transcriptional regulator n=1 Tax=Companilactobacillus huachuanensis TaxID=2559914 RepID=A0ABW1RQJ4_9LACO|nr:sugar-binding transcriptional regulator [Companilactobacillus huachuanensis]
MEDFESKRMRNTLKASRYYYENDYDQSKIAKVMGLSRPTVSRLLQFAKDNGYIQIKIIDPLSNVQSLENRLKEKYSLKNVIVTYTASNEYQPIIQNIGKAAAKYLETIVKDGDSIGVSWGRTLNEIAENLSPNNNPQENVKVVQIKGGVAHSKMSNFALDVISKFAEAFHTISEILPLPIIFESAETSRLVQQDAQTQSLMDGINNTNITVFTVGSVKDDNMMFNLDYLNTDEIATLKKDAVGDIGSRFINSNGEIANEEINERTIGISLDNLKNKEHSILVAGGEHKVDSIKAALKGSYATDLITDNFTAQELLQN